MSIVSVSEQFQPNRYLLVSLRTEEGTITTTNIIVSDLTTSSIDLVTIEKGPQGERGLVGPAGPAGKDGLTFSILPVSSGGTNNTSFNSGYLISYDGNKLASSSYTIQDIIDLASANSNAITGIIPGTGLQKTQVNNNTAILDIKIGEGLTVSSNKIVVDNTIARTAELSLGAISGMVPISKGGTNNDIFNLNQLIYYNGTKLTSLPLNTGTIVVSGSSITIEAGSGLVGGGQLSIPNGSVLLQIGASADILVEENSISLSETGVAGTYTKVITDSKGRVVSGLSLTALDILSILGYTPWHPGNDGSGSGLDADLLDGLQGSFYRDSTNLTGVLSLDRLPNLHASGDQYGTKFRINAKGLIDGVYYASYNDIVDSLGFRPLKASESDRMDGFLTVAGGLAVSGGETSLYDNLPLFGLNSPNILPSEPRGFTFQYGATVANKTGILAYYPTENQLRLITNIYGSGAVGDVDGNGNSFQDDINGGSASTIYITQNLEGDKLTVLFREIADQIYINTNQEQTINALKKFLQGIDVVGQIRFLSNGAPPSSPPFDLAGNSIKVNNLNADLLDDRDGAYYRNASNITGSFSYNNVTFDHIEGTNNYIPKFTDSVSPARKITSSNIKQRVDGDIEITNDVNLVIGEDNTIGSSSLSSLTAGTFNIIESENSIAIGDHNKVYGTESAAIGSYNTASGINSVALNYGSIAKGKNSIALGSYGLAELENQIAFGAFRTTTGTTVLEHGQYSTVAAYLKGIETHGSWISLSPVIQLPKEKTIAYNIELLMNKGLSSGVAHFSFTSGIINNATYRDPNNISNIINTTTVPNIGYKTEAYNNSQLRRHVHKWTYQDMSSGKEATKTQYVWAKSPPAQNLSVDLRYLYPYYFYTPENVAITGVFEKSHDGSLVLDIHRPRYYESFTQHPLNNTFVIQTQKPHQAVAGAMLECQFSSASMYLPPSGRYIVQGAPNSNSVAVTAPKWMAVKYGLPSGAKLVVNAPSGYDKFFNTNIPAAIQGTSIQYNSAYLVNQYGYALHTFIKPNMTIKIQYKDFSNNIYNYRRVITSITSSTININAPIKTIDINPTIISGPVSITIDDFSAHLFKSCNKLWVDGEALNILGAQTRTSPIFNTGENIVFVNDGGAGDINNPLAASLIGLQNSGFVYEPDAYGDSSFSITTATRIDRLIDGQSIEIAPLFTNNSGNVDIYARTDLACNYSSVLSDINVHTGVYVRYNIDNYQSIRLFDTNYQPLDFISAPMNYELVNGSFSEFNNKFRITRDKNRYFLYTNEALDYENNNVIPIRVRCTPQNINFSSFYEQVLYVYVQNLNEIPKVNIVLEPTGIPIDNVFVYSLPGNMFVEPDSGVLQYSANIKGGHPLPRWLSFDAINLVLSGTPDQCDIGSYSIDIKATDASGLYAFNNLIIEVSGNPVITSNVLASGISEILKINSIQLAKNTVLENSKDTLVGELLVNGGYNPYIFFGSASNSVSGIFMKGSDLFRHAQPTTKTFSNIVTLSGAPQLFGIGTNVFARSLPISDPSIGLSGNTKVTKTYRPTVLSGTPISGNLFIFDNIYIPYRDFAVFTGQYLGEQNLSECFGTNLRAKEISDFSIILGRGLIQEAKGLVLTENNDALDHEYSIPQLSFKVEQEGTIDDLKIEDDLSYLAYKDNTQKSVAWSKKISYSKLFDEKLENTLSSEVDTLIGDNESNFEYITHPVTLIDVFFTTENNYSIVTENKEKINGIIVDERVWFSTYPFRIRRNLRENIELLPTGIVYNPLRVVNPPTDDDNEGLFVSNIDYARSDLLHAYDSWTFLEHINNPILYVNGIGSNDTTQLITDDRNYTGYFYNSSPFEYAILSTEDNFGLIPETEKLNGSRIELSNRYELLDTTKIYPNNGKIFAELLEEELLCENNDRLVHDYAILAHSGSAYILFPGTINQIVLKYPTVYSYTATEVNNGSLGYYEDNLENRPTGLSFTEPDFYYSWGKLVPYYAYTNEYAIRLSNIYDRASTSGLLVYTGIAPADDNYFPEESLYNSVGLSSGDCPVNIPNSIINGMVVHDDLVGSQYVTGVATFYTSFAANDITITSNKDFNKDLRINDYVYLYEALSNQANALFPRTDTYTDVLSSTSNTIKVRNLFLYPSNRVVTHTGSIRLNLDRNHEQIIKSPDYVNRLPIKFNSVYNTNSARLPKNYLFDIIGVSGQKVVSSDNARYLLKSDEYLDSIVSGTYMTNGFKFFGSLFHDHEIIYDVRKLDKEFSSTYTNITFEYRKDTKILSLNLPTGIVSIFDNIRLSNFQPLSPSMIWDHNATYNTGFKVFKENLSIRNIDDVPDKDFVLLERSAAVLQPENKERLSFITDIFAASSSGTCYLDVNLTNRLDRGFILNYNDNLSKTTGHQYLDYNSGYSFTGIIPRYHKIISTTGTLNDTRIGYASIFNSGNQQWSSGIRTVRRAEPTDIGYVDFYHIYSTGFTNHINNIPYLNMKGVGSPERWYITDIISTSGSNKMLQFLYLGHNTNTIKIFGGIQTSSEDSGFSITKITYSQQTLIDKLADLGVVSGVTPIFTTGTNGLSGNLDITIPVTRFDTITIELNGNTTSNFNYLQLNTYVENTVNTPGLLLDSAIPIFTDKLYYPRNNQPLSNSFYILPSISTSTKYCNTNKPYNKNNTIYYNGNLIVIDNLSSVKSYCLENEQLRIKDLNRMPVSSGYARFIQKINPVNQLYSITGISLDGSLSIPSSIYDYQYASLRENTVRHLLPFGTGTGFLPNIGTISFIPHYSGTFDLINYNNIYLQSYGGYTARWPQDVDAVISNSPLTGVYAVFADEKICNSNKLCVTITPYLGSSFASLNSNDSYYFDFDSVASSISTTYRITDFINSNKISISPNYNSSLVGSSGLVYIIPSKYNIKTHLYPNIDNTFITQSLAVGLNTQLVQNSINYFDSSTKKWTHLFHLVKNIPIYSGYALQFNNDTTNIIYNNKDKIGITNLSIYNNTGMLFDNIGENFTIYSDSLGETIRISTSGGSPMLVTPASVNIPKIYISGLASYRTLTNASPLLYGYRAGSGWDIGVEIIPMNKTGVYPLTIIARDETGDSYKTVNMIIKDKKSVNTTYPTGYFTTSDTEWFLNFDTTGLDLLNDFPGNQGITLFGTPNDFSYDIDIRDASTISVQGYRLAGGGGSTIPFSTGIWNPVIRFADFYTSETIAVGTGTIKILSSLNDRPPFVPTLNKVKTDYYVDISQLQNISFYIPVYEQVANPSTFFSAPGINTTTSISWDGDTNRYIATVIPKNTGDSSYLSETKYIAGGQFSYNVNQYLYVDGSPSTVNYSSSTYNFNLTFYRPMMVSYYYNSSSSGIFSLDQPWTYEFALQEGVIKHRPDKPPRVKLYNTPSIGDNSNIDLSYKVRYRYNENGNYWIVLLEGKPDIYGRYAANTGTYNIKFTADDQIASSITGSFNITYKHTKSINYIQSNIYTTPNNEFFINADIVDKASGNKASNQITFAGNNSLFISPNQASMQFDSNLNIWEFYATGNKLIDKWDARLIVDTNSQYPSLTLQCKGIADDKITAVAKVNLLELQNNNLDIVEGLPIKITGINNGNQNTPFTPESGLIVQQGEKWQLNFKTIFGLQSPQNPPSIFLSGTPTVCSGYDPRLDPLYNTDLPPNSQLHKCIATQPLFNTADKSWNFSFSGDPSCLLSGELDFSIIAIDTNLANNPIYIEPSDSIQSVFTYIPTTQDHPVPNIVQGSAPEFNIKTAIKPGCDSYFNVYKFGPANRSVCPIPTGLSGIITSGSLPTGLTYSIQYSGPEGNLFNAPHYDNVNSGVLTIQGSVSYYPPSGSSEYPDKFYLTIIDARGKKKTQEIIFGTSVTPMAPNIYMTLYFENADPIFTPSTGNDKITMGGITVKQPEASVLEMTCYSTIPFSPHCAKFPVMYSGADSTSTDFLVLHPVASHSAQYTNIQNNSFIYFNMLELNNNDGNYYVKKATSLTGLPNHVPLNSFYIKSNESISSPHTGIAEIVISTPVVKAIADLATVFNVGDVTLSTEGCVLGNGRVAADLQGRYGIYGFVSPSFSGYIPTGGYFASSDTFGTGLRYNVVDDTSRLAEIKYTTCPETGFVRFSGVSLPPIYIEITDPPPLANRSYGDDGTTFSLNSRLAYGDSIIERNKPQNERAGTAYYTVTNLVSNSTIQSGSVSVAIQNSAPIRLTSSTLAQSANNKGATFRIDYSCAGGAFPTFDPNTNPTATPSIYSWVHKAGLLGDIPTENSFPAVTISYPDTFNIYSGELINYNSLNGQYGIRGLALGGYIPTDICIGGLCPDGYTNYPYLLSISGNNGSIWSSSSYLPSISGIILNSVVSRKFNNSGNIPDFTKTAGYYSAPTSLVVRNDWIASINSSPGQTDIYEVFDVNNLVEVTVTYTPPFQPTQILDVFITGLTSGNFDLGGLSVPNMGTRPIVFSKNYGSQSLNLDIDLKPVTRITNIDLSGNLIYIRHNNLSMTEATTNIILDKITSQYSDRFSSVFYTMEDKATILSVNSISNTGLVLIAGGGSTPSGIYRGFSTNDSIKIHSTIEDNIKIMPANIDSNTEGNFDFLISGRPNILYGQYNYRVITRENPLAPIFVLGWRPKAFYKDCIMNVGKPLSIVSSTVSWGQSSNSWTVTLNIDGGVYPALSQRMKVKIDRTGLGNWTYCGFNRFQPNTNKDTYNSTTGLTTITLSSSNGANWGPGIISSFDILVYDDSGSDTITINRQA